MAIEDRFGKFFEGLSFKCFLVCLAFMFVVKFEPAPSDIFFVFSFGALLFSGQIYFDRRLNLFWALAGVFLLFNFIPALFWKSASYGLRYVAITIYLMLIPLVMGHFASRYGAPAVDKFYKSFFAAAGLSAVIGLLAVLRLAPGPASLYFLSDDGLRLAPLFKDPNVYGPYMGAAGVLALGYALRPSCTKPTLVMSISFISLAMMFLTFSRGAWVGTAGALFFMTVFILFWTRRRRPLVLFGTLATVGSAPIILLGTYFLIKLDLINFLLKRFALQSYDSHRFSNWGSAFEIIESRPLGIGPGHYVGRRNFPESDFGLATHNVYLKVAVENGWIGFISFFGMVLVITLSLYKTFKWQDDRQTLRIAVAAVIIGQFGTSLAVDSLHWRHLFVVFGFACCELIVCHKARLSSRWRATPEPERFGRFEISK